MQITEQQLQEIAGRLNALVVNGLANAEHLAAIASILKRVAETKKDQSNG